MRKSKSFFLCLVLSCAVLLQGYSEPVYSMTESELKQIELNNQTIQNNLEILKKQYKAQAELLKESENEKKVLTNIVIPVCSLLVAGAFIGGVCTGLQINN